MKPQCKIIRGSPTVLSLLPKRISKLGSIKTKQGVISISINRYLVRDDFFSRPTTVMLSISGLTLQYE